MTYLADQIARARDGDTITLPAGRYVEAQPLKIEKAIKIVGQRGFYGPEVTEVVCPGIEVWSQGAELSGLTVKSDGTPDRDGVRVSSKCHIEDCQFQGFRDGVAILADARSSIDNGTPYENANNTSLRGVRAVSNTRHGFFVDGSDTNVCLFDQCDAMSNTAIGFFDSGFLGNTYVACHTADNAQGYKTDNANARHVFIGCYAESGQLDSQWSQHTLVLGGIRGPADIGGQVIGFGHQQVTEFNIRNTRFYARYGHEGAGGMTVRPEGDTHTGVGFGFVHERSGAVDIRHANLDARIYMAMTTDVEGPYPYRDTAGEPIPAGNVVFPREPYVGGETLGEYVNRLIDERPLTAGVSEAQVQAMIEAALQGTHEVTGTVTIDGAPFTVTGTARAE